MPTVKVTPTKWSAAASWESPEEKPTNLTDALFVEKSATGAALKLETSVSCRSIEMVSNCTGTLVMSAGLTTKIGNAASLNASNIAIKLASAPGFTLTNSGITWELLSSITTGVPQTITCAGQTLPALAFSGKGAKWELADELKCGSITLTEGTLTSGGQKIGATSVSLAASANGATLKLGASVATLTGEWKALATNLTFSAETSTIKLTGAEVAFAGGTLTYNIVTLENKAQKVKDSSTFATLNVNNKGDATGISLEKGTTQTVTTLATNGTSGEPAKLISDTGGTQAKLKITGAQTVSYLKCKDIKVETGTLTVKIPEGTKAEYDLGGNEGITFEEAGAVGGLSMMV